MNSEIFYFTVINFVIITSCLLRWCLCHTFQDFLFLWLGDRVIWLFMALCQPFLFRFNFSMNDDREKLFFWFVSGTKHGISDAAPAVLDVVSLAVQERLKKVVEQLSVISQHRLEIYRVSCQNVSEYAVNNVGRVIGIIWF